MQDCATYLETNVLPDYPDARPMRSFAPNPNDPALRHHALHQNLVAIIKALRGVSAVDRAQMPQGLAHPWQH